MPTFLYKARGTTGKAVHGTMEAATKEALIDKLRKMGYMTTRVTEARGGAGIESWFENLRPVGAGDMILFYVQLSNMIGAGIPLLAVLEALSKQVTNKRLREAVGNIARSVEGGESFSEALEGHPHIFPKLFLNMVRAGEVSGKLDTVSLRFARYFEHQVDLKQKIKGALFYPAILLMAGIAVTLFIVTFIIPQFVNIFLKSGIELPLPTLILFRIGIGIKRFWYLALLFFAAAYAGMRSYAKTKNGKLKLDRLKLGIPIFGYLHKTSALSGFARTLATLTESGVPILQSLDVTRNVVGNEVLGLVLENARAAVEKGEKISEPLRVSGEFPPDAIQMISVGEETGSLDKMLDKMADFYDMSVGYAIKKLTTLLEPIFLLVMGSMVGFIMASMLLPMFDMITVLKR